LGGASVSEVEPFWEIEIELIVNSPLGNCLKNLLGWYHTAISSLEHLQAQSRATHQLMTKKEPVS
jgi:hypothetical protein